MRLFGYEVSKVRPPTPAQIDKAKSVKQKDKAAGFYGLKTSSGIVEEEFIRDLRWPDCGKVYQEMSSNDAVVGACIYLIETLIRRAKWTVEPFDNEDADNEAVEFLRSCMYDMNGQTWDEFISDVLSMLVYGFSFHEIIYKVRRGPDEKDPRFRSKYTDGKIGWQCLPIRSQATMREWTFDEKGNVLEFVQDPGQVGAQGQVVNLPIEGNLLFRTKANRNNPEGWSILRRAYRSWYFKKYIEELEGIGIERNLAGIPHLQPSDEVDLFDKDNPDMVAMLAWAQQLVDGLRQDTNHGIITPNGWTLTLLSPKGGAAIDTDAVIHRHESRMAVSMLADVILMGGDRTGSFALAEVKQDILTASLQYIINSICDTLNTYAVPQLFILNGMPTDRLPKITTEALKPTSIKEVALLLRSLGLDVAKNQDLFNFLMRLINAPTISDIAELEAMSGGQGTGNNTGNGDDDFQDPADNAAKQSDMDYV